MFEKHRSLFTRALLLIALVFAGWWLLRSPEGKLPAATTVSYSELLSLMQDNRISDAKFETSSSRLLMTLKAVEATAGKPAEPAKQVVAVLPVGDTETINKLAAGGVAKVDIIPRPQPSNWPVFLPLFGILILVGVMIWLHRRSQSGAGGMDKAMGFGKSKSEAVDPSQNLIRLKDVAGCDEAKAEVEEVVNFLKNPSDYHRLGGKVPRGVLLAGPPGTGKTLLAKAVAGEAGVPFFFVSGSEFVEMFVGVGASRVRDMFAQAKAQAPAIIFVDEIDAVGARRGAGNSPGGGGDSEREQTLNQMLVEMDGFRPNEGIIVLAATNRPEMLDPALLRAGRFDREVRVDLPDREGRAAILALHARTVPVDIDVDWDIISRGTPGFSGADLANLINEAALKAAREKAVVVNLFHLEWARDRVMMGAEKQGGMKNEKERRIVAYHEAGHALVARFSEHAEPVHKITIVPRGRSLGLTMQLPREDSYNHDRDMLLTNITVLMGGRAAEDVALGTSTVGASNDFARAASLARRMVASWGMSPEMGPVSIDGESGTPLGYDNGWSESTKRRVDKTVEALLRAEYERAKDLLATHRSILESVALALLEHETLDAAQFEKLVVQGLGTQADVPAASAASSATDARLAF